MVKRVIIQSGGASPFRVSVAGVDAAGAQFNNLIFDGNQPPLRLFATGFVTIPVVDALNNAAAFFTDSALTLPVVPAGTVPIFLCQVRQPNTGAPNPGAVGNQNTPAFRTLNAFGLGGAIFPVGGVNVFTGINFNRDNTVNGLFAGNQGVVNFAIMKNFQ